MSIRTLAIASASSAIAAIVTSRLWAAGTPIAAAMTPVLVTIVSEMLHRPTAKIAERFTVETDALPDATGSGPPPREAEARESQPAREMPDSVRVYRSSGSGAREPRSLPWKLIFTTAGLAFLIAVAVLTIPRVFAGESLLKGSPPGYSSAGQKKDKSEPADEDNGQAPTETEQEPQTTPESTTTTEETETETAPETTTTAPEPPAGEPAPRTVPQTPPNAPPQQ